MNLFDHIKDDIGQIWSQINKLLKPVNVKKENIQLRFDGALEGDSQVLAEKMNSYFSTIGNNINSSIDDSYGNDFLRYLQTNNRNLLFLNPVDEEEVTKVILSLKCKSVPVDAIPLSVIKFLSPIITPVLTFLINKTFAEGEFPKSFKIAKIVPIFKGGDKENITNYRPIYILSNFSKIFEKCMYKRLYDYLIANNFVFWSTVLVQKEQKYNAGSG